MTTKSSALAFCRPLTLAGLVFSLALMPALSGCFLVAAGAAGAGAVAYVRGELEATLGNDYERVVDATREALKQLEFVKVSENKDALKAVFIFHTALDKKVEVDLSRLDDKSTKVQIRVGLIGDQEMSTVILEKIKSRL